MSAYEMATQRSGATHVKTTLVDDVQAHEIDVYWYVFNRYPLCPTTISARIWTHYPREPHHDRPAPKKTGVKKGSIAQKRKTKPRNRCMLGA